VRLAASGSGSRRLRFGSRSPNEKTPRRTSGRGVSEAPGRNRRLANNLHERCVLRQG